MLTHHPPRKAFLQPQIFITLENMSDHEPSDCRLALLTAPHPTPASWGWSCVHSWEKWVMRVPRPVDGRVSPLLRLLLRPQGRGPPSDTHSQCPQQPSHKFAKLSLLAQGKTSSSLSSKG